MSASFNPALATRLDRARLLLGDTGTIKDSGGDPLWLLDNATIDALIQAEGFAEGVAQAAEALITRFAQEPDELTEEGDRGLSLKWTERVSAWRELAARMRSGLGGSAQVVRGGRVLTGQPHSPDMTKLRLGSP